MGKPLRVLIVEDSEDDALLVVRELQRGGYKVTSERVETAQAMQAALERKKWDVVIADYTLPNFSAPAALQLLHESGLDLPFIVVSGTIGEDTAVATMKTGAHDYIMKSSLKRLVPAIERELGDAKVRRERKQAEEALQESEEKYRALIENSPNLIAIYQDGHFKYVNKAACNRWGRTYEELTSPSFGALETLASEDLRHIVEEKIAQRLRGEYVAPYEINMKSRDGSEFPVLVYGGVISYGGKPANEYNFVDITERKRAEEALRQSEEKLRQMFESVTDGILVTDLNGVITEVNQRVVEMHGFASRDELLGKSALELIAPRNHKKIANNMRKTLRQGTVKNMEYTLLRADGTEFPGELSTSLLLDASGNWVGRITIVRDITERLEAERKARELQLLKEVDNLRHQLLSNVSHELRTPLTSIKGFISTLLRTDVKWSEEEQRDFLETIDEESDRLIILINDLLDMSRIDAGALKLDKDYYHISEILESIDREAGYAHRIPPARHKSPSGTTPRLC